MSEEPRSKLRGIFQGKSQNMAASPKPPFAIHPLSKLQGILAFSHKGIFLQPEAYIEPD